MKNTEATESNIMSNTISKTAGIGMMILTAAALLQSIQSTYAAGRTWTNTDTNADWHSQDSWGTSVPGPGDNE